MKSFTYNNYEWLLKDPPFYPPFKIINGDIQIEIVDDDTIPDILTGSTYEENKFGYNGQKEAEIERLRYKTDIDTIDHLYFKNRHLLGSKETIF